MAYSLESHMQDIHAELDRVDTLGIMLHDNVTKYYENDGRAGGDYEKNHNASKTALLNQITTLRNELLVLAETIRA